MEAAEWAEHRRLRAARTEMPCPRVISLRIAFGSAFGVSLRNPGAKSVKQRLEADRLSEL